MSCFVLVDIGGTAIKHALSDAEGTIYARGQRPTEAQQGGQSICRKVVEIVRQYRQQAGAEGLAGVAIDTAGVVKPGEEGEILFAGEQTFPGYTGTRLGKTVQDATGLAVAVENDVNAAALGEYWKGAARGAASVFMATVGTNVGGALLFDGRVFHGASCSAGEIGYLRVHGQKRLFQEIASTQSLIREAAVSHNLSPAELSGEQVFAWAEAGDREAQQAIERFAANLAEGLADVCALLNPERLVLGGAVMAQEKVLRPLLEAELERLVPPSLRAATTLSFAHLGNDAGMIGALYLLRSKLGLA